MNTNDNAERAVFAPQTISRLAVDTITERSSNPKLGLLSGLPGIDTCQGGALVPQQPTDLRVVLGYTSNYKTGLMNYIARYNAKKLIEQNDTENKVIITVTWEQSVEEQGIIDLSQISQIDTTRMFSGEMTQSEWSSLRIAAVKRGALPWWIIGHSGGANARRPRLTLTDVARALEYIIDVQKVTPRLIVLDYLQRMAREGNDRDVRVQFMSMVDRCKDMALAYRCPVMLGTQASRDLKRRIWRMPQTDDGQETSNLEQSADSMIATWLPKKDYPLGHVLEYGGEQYTVGANTLLIDILKQKFGDAPRIYEMHVKPEINEIYATASKNTVDMAERL